MSSFTGPTAAEVCESTQLAATPLTAVAYTHTEFSAKAYGRPKMKYCKHPLIMAGVLLAGTVRVLSQTPAANQLPTEDAVVELSPFVVSASASEGNQVSESTSGTLVSRPLNLLPMGVSVVSAEMMKEMDIFNADGLSRIVAGLANQNNTTSEGTGNNTQYSSRGFTVLPRRNGFAPGGRLYDMTGVDRVEVIRGPNSLLYGQSDPGGIINYVTKRPRLQTEAGAHGVITAVAGNYDFYRAQMDVDLTLIPAKLGFRLPASYTTNEREFNFFRNEVTAYNPSILWRIFPRTEITFEYEYLDVKTNFAAFQPITWTPPGGKEFVDKNKRGLGRSFNFFGPHARAENEQTNWTFDVTSRLTDNITFRGIYSKNNRDRNEITPTGGDPFRVVPVGYRGQWIFDGNAINGYKADLLAEYEIGRVTTRTVVGYEYNENDFFVRGYQGFRNGANDNFYVLNVGFDPATGKATRIPTAAEFLPFPDTTLDPNFWRVSIAPARFRSKWTNTRVSEVLSAFDERVQLLGGVARGESVLVNLTTGSEQENTATVYQVGVGFVIDSAKQHMLFANKSTSYQPQFLFDINNDPLPPQTADGVEGGIKSTWGQSGLSTTLTLFTQKRTNVGRQFTNFELNRTYGVLTPGEESKGVEFELWYRPTKQIEIHANFAKFDGEITGAAAGREFLLGQELPRSPDTSANFFSNFRFADTSVLAGFKVGVGVTYKNDTWLDLGQGNNTWLTRRSDAYTVFWMTASKEFKLANKRAIVLRLNVGNLLDKEYITEGSTYGENRTVRIATDFKF